MTGGVWRTTHPGEANDDAGTRGYGQDIRDRRSGGMAMGNIRSFKELRAWQYAMEAAMRAFELAKRFPAGERYSLTDPFRRASRSVASNIAEAWRNRRYPAGFVSKLNDAEGEAAGSQAWAEVSRRCRYLSEDDAAGLDQRYEQILGQRVNMIKKPEDWIGGGNRRPTAKEHAT